MTYQQAGRIAILKRIAGWIIFIPALISTLISLLKFMYEHSAKQPGIDAVMMDFVHVMVEMMRFNTPFLNVFWYKLTAARFQQQSERPVLGYLCADFCGISVTGFWSAYVAPGEVLT
ncbi:Uncharacterised protein [Kluyvera intermedia]|nr:Uncharacterised protein [Kluyvera intermedia]